MTVRSPIKPPVRWQGINRQSDQARGLISWWPFSPSAYADSVRAVAGGEQLDNAAGNPAWVTDNAEGRGRSLSSGNRLSSSDARLPVADQPRTVTATLRFRALPVSADWYFGYGAIVAHQGFYCGAWAPNGGGIVFTDIGGAMWGTGTTLAAGVVYRIAWSSYGGNVWAAWINGVPEPLTGSGMAGNLNTILNGTAQVGGSSPVFGDVANVDLFDLRVYDHGFTDAEAQRLCDPRTRYDLHRKPVRFARKVGTATATRFRRTNFLRAGSRGIA